MLIVLSPAKKLDFDTSPKIKDYSLPAYLDDSKYLVEKLRKLSSRQLKKMMGVSHEIATLNEERFKEWNLPFTASNAKQAALAFKGDVYVGLDPDTYNENDFEFAQDHVRILSGLYGVLRPLDLIQAYRLEMGTRFKITAAKNNLYKFWGSKITEGILDAMKEIDSNELINLASHEYFKSVKTDILNKRIITPVFKDYKNGEFKVIQFLAKKARGLMTSYIVKNKLTNADDIKGFDSDGYEYNDQMTKNDQWVFTRIRK